MCQASSSIPFLLGRLLIECLRFVPAARLPHQSPRQSTHEFTRQSTHESTHESPHESTPPHATSFRLAHPTMTPSHPILPTDLR